MTTHHFSTFIGKSDGTPNSWSSILSILTETGCDLGHPMNVIMTGQLKNHDRPMFPIIAGITYNLAIPCYQALPGQLITWSSHDYNRSRSRCPSCVTIIAGSRCTTCPLTVDFNSEWKAIWDLPSHDLYIPLNSINPS